MSWSFISNKSDNKSKQTQSTSSSLFTSDWTSLSNINIDSWSFGSNTNKDTIQNSDNSTQCNWNWGATNSFGFKSNNNKTTSTIKSNDTQVTESNNNDDGRSKKLNNKAVDTALDEFRKAIQISSNTNINHNKPTMDLDINHVVSSLKPTLSWQSTLDLLPSIGHHRLYLQTSPNAEMQLVEYSPDDPINIIIQRFNIDPALSIIHKGDVVDINKSFNDQNIKNGAYLTTAKTVTVTIQHPTKKPQLLKLLVSDKLLDFQRKIANLFAVQQWSFRIYLSKYGKELHYSGYTVEQYGIHDGQCLFIKMINRGSYEVWKHPTSKITINTRLRNMKNLILDNISQKMTVFMIKLRVQSAIRIYHARFRLIYQGHIVPNSRTLLQLGVSENDSMTLNMIYNVDTPTLNLFNDLLVDDDIQMMNTNSMRYTQDKLYQKAMNQWYKTCGNNNNLKIESVFKIKKNYRQNMSIYNAVLATKKRLGKEALLYHGTSFLNAIQIINTGFNRDYNIKSVYGKGTYFSNKSKIAARYCKGRCFRSKTPVYAMLACQVYIGDSTVGRVDMKESELYKQDKITQYDSLVNAMKNPSIFVINRDYHAVPCYVIVFRECANQAS